MIEITYPMITAFFLSHFVAAHVRIGAPTRKQTTVVAEVCAITDAGRPAV
jgi:hypothetical protein